MSALSEANAAKTHCPAGHAYEEHGRVTVRGYRVCRVCKRESVRRAREAHKEKRADYARARRASATQEERAKENARSLVRKRVYRGQMVKPTSCEECGAGGRIEAHHDDYTRPLDVRWLCCQCHTDVHRALVVERSEDGSRAVLA